MKRRAVKIIALLTALTLVTGALTGCGGSDKGSSAETKSSTSNSQGNKGDGGVTIKVALQKHTAVDVMQTVFNEFTSKSGIKITADVLPQEQIIEKTQIALSSGSSDYDAVMYDHMFTTQFASAGWIEDLAPYISKTSYDVDDFMEGFTNSLSFNGKLYALPIYGESTMLMYNKELFEKAGISAPPKNKAEFDEAVKKLDAKGIPAFACRGSKSPGSNIYIWSGFFLGMGGNWFDKEGKLTLNTPEAKKATEYYVDLLKNHSVAGVDSFNWDQVQLAIQQGKVAMAVDATNFAPRVENKENSTVVGKMGYVEVPEGLMTPSTACWGLAIPTASKNKDASWEFIQWALNADVQLKTSIDGDRCDVTRKSVMADKAYTDKYGYDNGTWIKTTISAMSKAPADYRPRVAEWSILGDAIAGAVSASLAGDDVQKSLDQAQADCSNIKYADYGK